MTFMDVLKNDGRLIRRDSILIGMFIFIVYIGTVLHFGLPWLDNYLASAGILPNENNSRRLADFFPLITANLIIYTGPNIIGAVFAFIILGEKDENTLSALLVSPLSPGRYISYRIILVFLATSFTVAFLFIYVNQALPAWPALLAVVIGSGQTGVIILLAMIITADGRVQGMTYSKFISFFGYMLIASWWVPEPFQFLFGLFPPFWITKAYWAWLAGENLWLLYFSAGLLFQGAVIRLLRNLYKKRIYSNVL